MNAPGDEAFAQSAKRLKMDDTVRILLVSLNALWSRTAKNTDLSTGPLSCNFARFLAPLTRLLALRCLLCSRAPLHLLTVLTPLLVRH